MKHGKKFLSVLLAVMMIISSVSVCFGSIMVSAVSTGDVKSAFEKVTDTSTLTDGDGSLLNAAEVLYNYVYSIASTSCNGVGGNGNGATLSAKANNSSVDLNNAAKSAAGSAYNAVINKLIPTSGVTDDSAFSRQNGSKTLDSWTCQTDPGFKESWVGYNINSDANSSVTVSANLEKVLLACASLDDVDESILLSATYNYTNTVRHGYAKHNSDTKKWGILTKRVWYWSSASWHTLSQKPTRTAVKTDTNAYKNLHAFADYFTSAKLSLTLADLCKLDASAISSEIASNNEFYAKLDSYSENVKNHFFDMTAVKEYMDNCLFAQKVINARPAIVSMSEAMSAGYDKNNLDSMNAIYTAQAPNLEFLSGLDADVMQYVAENYDECKDFSLEGAKEFMTVLEKDIQLFKIRQIKAAVDALRAQYPDAEAIKTIEDNQLLWNYYDLIKGYGNALSTSFTPSYVQEVFTEGTGYVTAFENELKFEWDYREAATQYESYWSWLLPLVYADLTKVDTDLIIGSSVAQNIPNIKNAEAKKTAFEKMYQKYLDLIGKDSMEEIFGSGENALGAILDDYIARLYSTILARLESEVSAAVGYYDTYGEVNLSNFTAIKDAIGKVETDIWNFLEKNNSSIISEQLRANYEKLSSLLSMYNKFVSSGGLDGFEQKHLHDSNGVFMTRQPGDDDLARTTGEGYDVTEEVINETIEKLDKFLTSSDFTNLVNIDADNLSDYIKEVLADNLYTNDFVNMLMAILYPALADALEDLYRSLPSEVWYDAGLWKDKIKIGYKSLPDLISGLGLGIYPNQVAGYIDGYSKVKNALAGASSWNSLMKDGKLTLDWGIDSIKPENYDTTAAFLSAKKGTFLGAMAESFDAILPIVRILLCDWDDYNTTVSKAGYGEYLSIKLNADLNLTADGCAGYSDFVVPVLEALGCDGIADYSTVRGYTNSRQIVNAIFNPLIDFVENKLAKSPVSTLCSVLPNLAYAIPMDKLWSLLDYLNITLNYKANDSILNIQVVKDSYQLRVADMVNKNSLGLDFDISSFSSIISYVVGMFVKDFDSSTLPVMNSGELITFASLDKNAPTKRHSGKRINFTADKADVFMAVLNYLVKCLGDDNFVQTIFAQFSKEEEMSDALKQIVQNIYTSANNEQGNMALAAIIELLNQTDYRLEEYNWFEGENASGSVEGTTPASSVYLSYSNNWTKEAADYVSSNLNEIVSGIIKTAGSDVDIAKELTASINTLFTNANITALAKALSSISGLGSQVNSIIKEQLGVDLDAFKKYADLADDATWGFEDGDKDGFIDAMVEVLSPLEPIYGFLFKGENLHLYKNSADVVFYGNNGYDNAIVPVLEALGCKVPESGSFEAKDTVKVVLTSVANRLYKLGSDPLNEILDLLPSVLYYLSSNALSTSVGNLLHPVYVILDTIRPVYPLNLSDLISGQSEQDRVDLEKLDVSFFVSLLEKVTGLKLTKLESIVKDVSSVIGTSYDSKSEYLKNAKIGAYTDGKFDRADMLTVVISYLLDELKTEGNAEAFDKLIGAENFTAALLAVFEGTDAKKKTVNWMYYFGQDVDLTKIDFASGLNISKSIEAIGYENNWTAESAAYVNANLDSIANEIVSAAKGEKTTLGDVLKEQINLYSPETLTAINDAVKNAVSSLDENLLKAAGYALGIDFDAINAYTAPEKIETSEQFASELEKVLKPLDGVLNWLLFGKDYRFYKSDEKDESGAYTGADAITIKGAQGYKDGLVLVLEALGCENLPDSTESDALSKIISSAVARLDEILADPASELLDLLPNAIYFVNADGLTASVYNTLGAVYALIESLEPLGVKADINELLGFDLSDLSFDRLIALAEEKTGLDLSKVSQMFSGLCVGTIKQYDSLSGEYAYKMSYNSELDRKDMLTIIITVLVETVKLDGNAETLEKLIGQNAYDAVMNVLKMRKFDMQQPTYKYSEYADTDKVFSAMENSELYKDYTYGPLYTEKMAEYIANNIDSFLDNLVYLLGINIGGKYVTNLEDAINALVNGSLYNSKNAQALLDKLLEYSAKIDALPAGSHIKALIKESLGVDMSVWESYSVPTFDNDREKFTAVLCDILEPLYPVLDWMLCNKDFTFFTDENGKDLVTLLGAQGYAYGVIPLLEALDCKNVKTPEQYYAAASADSDNLVKAIVDPLFDRIDNIMEDPAQRILEILPQLIYFVNSGGLDTCFKNALHSVYGLLNAIEPLVKVDLYDLIGIRLDEATFESLFAFALEKIEESTGQKLDSISCDAFVELSVGKLVSYKSANGTTAYKMVYASSAGKTEMVTVAERLIISFIMSGENREKLITILKDKFSMNETAETYVRAVLQFLYEYTVTNHLGMDKALFAIYHIFCAANTGTDYAASGLKKLNAMWKDILKQLDDSSDPNIKGLGTLIGEILDKYAGGIFDSNGLASSGLIVFFQKLAEFFAKLKAFFEKIFA